MNFKQKSELYKIFQFPNYLEELAEDIKETLMVDDDNETFIVSEDELSELE